MLPGELFLAGFDVFLFVFIRMTGLFVIAPIFGRMTLPVHFKIGFSLLMSLILVNVIDLPSPGQVDSLLQAALIAAKEFAVGITIGLISYLVFSAIYIAGELMDLQIGFGISNIIDPVSNVQVPLTANLYYILAMLVYLSVNGHHWLIKALFESYVTVPVGAPFFGPPIMNGVMNLIVNIFLIGFKIAAPVTAALLITDIALGTISRMVPQLNIFVVGLPLKILVGIAVMAVTVPMFIYLLESLFDIAETSTYQILKDLGPQ